MERAGSKGARESVLWFVQTAQITRGTIMCGLHSFLLGRGWHRGLMFKAPCSQSSLWGVPTVGRIARGLLLPLGTDKFGKQMLFRPFLEFFSGAGNFEAALPVVHRLWC